MAELISLSAAATIRFVQFNRIERKLLLNSYARHVADGGWRDYAIDHGPACAVFSIYRHRLERPAVTITKLADHTRPIYVVANGERELARCPTLADALAALDRAPRPIS